MKKAEQSRQNLQILQFLQQSSQTKKRWTCILNLMMKKNTMLKSKKMQGCLKKSSFHLELRLSQVMQAICLANLLLNYHSVMQIWLSKKNTPTKNLILEQKKKFKKKNWMQNFKKIQKKGKRSHLLLIMPKKRVMGRMKRINRLRDRRMRKQNLKRKVTMKKKVVRQRKRQSMKYFSNYKKQKKQRKNKKSTYFLILWLKSY